VGEALARGLARIGDGARAAVVAAVVSMEESALLNAGRGAALAEDGTVSLDAGFMDGQTRRFGGVAGVRRTATPVRIAELLASDGEFGRLLIGDAADAAARTAGIAETSPEALVSDHARERARLRVADSTAPRGDTVGAVALDAQGHVAAAVSTGGLAGKRAGRVGDSPIVGAGFWADDRIGAAVTTGIGEALMRHGTARRCIELVASGASLREAARRSIDELGSSAIEVGRSGGIGGIIALTRHGEIAIDHDTAEMASGWGSPGEPTVVRSRWRDPVA
jgi:beta-aspartyl-peptidase (threonine type)